MTEHFSREDLQELSIDPYEPAAIACCPWCGEDVVIGVNDKSRNITLAHKGHRDPTDTTGTRWVSGCNPFMQALKGDDVIRRLYDAGARFQKLER